MKNNSIQKKLIKDCVSQSAMILGYSLMFHIFCAIFLFMPDIAWFLVGIVFELCILGVVFKKSEARADRDYKAYSADSKSLCLKPTLLPFVYPIFFNIPMLLCILFGNLINLQGLNAVAAIIMLSNSMIFSALGLQVLSSASAVNIIFLSIGLLLINIAYVLGYFLGIAVAKQRVRDIEAELRMSGHF